MIRRQSLEDESGESLLSGLYIMLILAVVLFAAVETASYSMSVWKLYGAAGEVMDIMKAENGLDSDGIRRFHTLEAALGLEGLDVVISGTPKTVQRGDLLELRLSCRYRIQSLRPFGRELSVPISIRLSGLAHTYIRGL